jgi:hypothetical protein
MPLTNAHMRTQCRKSVGRVPPISIALAEARLRRGHPDALFHVQRRIPQLTDARLLLAASRQVRSTWSPLTLCLHSSSFSW